LNCGLSPDFSVQLKVSLSERLSERLNQKVKSPIGIDGKSCEKEASSARGKVVRSK